MANTITSVAVTDSSVTLASSNALRRGVSITNIGANTIYVAVAATATEALYTAPVVAGSYYEVPFDEDGPISAVCASGLSSTALVTVYL